MSEPQFNEIGYYLLAGAPDSPVALLEEAARGEELGLGSAFVSERFNIKEAATLSGAAAARDFGLVSRVVPPEQLNDATVEAAHDVGGAGR